MKTRTFKLNKLVSADHKWPNYYAAEPDRFPEVKSEA
jgi:hypothetical protein